MLTRLLFETPWWFPTLIAIAGITLCGVGDVRHRRGLLHAGIFVLLIAVAVVVISAVVLTDTELAVDGSKRLAAAVEQGDRLVMRPLLADGCTVWLGEQLLYRNREELLQDIPDFGRRTGIIREVRVTDASARRAGRRIVVTLSLLTSHQLFMSGDGRRIASTWALEWEQADGGPWQVVRIAAVNYENPLARP